LWGSPAGVGSAGLFAVSMMEKGKIYRYKKGVYKNPFVFVRYESDERFIGCMLTSSPNSARYPENISMKSEYFLDSKVFSECDKPVGFSDSNLVRVFLIEKTSDVSSAPCGGLTESGIEFLEKEIKDKNPVEWESKEGWPEFHV
jgi:hypothetical protein